MFPKIARSLLAAAALLAAPAAQATTGSYAADLEIVKSVAPAQVVPGQSAVYTLGVQNHGPDVADDTVVTDTLPAGVIYVENDCGASWAAPTLTWNVGDMPDEAIAHCHITVVVEDSASNTASVASNYFDPVADNNAAVAAVVALISPQAVPALGAWGALALVLALSAAAFLALRRG